ncbi:hypothetical protein SEUCBS139899_001824 [Sporothrix eucalyptigena]|uniref:CENP-V/GFA domain-containing protein n=1 Tax=Sporothrix eucalyptigena TaxID=1812306 RepID=A0ABP0CQK2_9PEZI
MAYQGNCHCGRYRFDLHVDRGGDDNGDDNTQKTRDVTASIPIVTCTCVACTKLGCLWHVVTKGHLVDTSNNTNEDSISSSNNFNNVNNDGTLPSPSSSSTSSPLLTTYRSGLVRYEFCSACGTGLFATHVKGPLVGQKLVNLRTIRGLNPFHYPRTSTDSSLSPDSPSSLDSSDSGSSTTEKPLPTTGACLCGSVTVELLIPLASMPLKEDNCSICTRNAWLGAYPRRAQVVVRGAQHTRDYRFGRRRFMGHPFCTTCGAHVFMNVYGPPQDMIDRMPEAKKELVRQNLDVMPINVRILDRIQKHMGSLAVAQSDEGTEGYERDVLGIVEGKTKGDVK